jgi:hypothetical protein
VGEKIMEQNNHYMPKEEEIMCELNRLLDYKRARYEKIIICGSAKELLDKMSQKDSKHIFLFQESHIKHRNKNWVDLFNGGKKLKVSASE